MVPRWKAKGSVENRAIWDFVFQRPLPVSDLFFVVEGIGCLPPFMPLEAPRPGT